jgi:hypothetical protein
VKRAKPFWLTRVAVVALLLSFFAACDDSTEPTFQLDPESTADIVDALVTDFFAGNDAANSVQYFGEYIGMALGGMPLLSAGPPAEVAGGIPDHLLRNPAYSAAANIPEIFEGVTFVWDDLDGVYIPSERLGAPANGVRFILYAVNPITEEPITPVTENEIGYLDISDDSTWPSIDITMEAVIGTATLIYAQVTGNIEGLSPWLGVDGYLADGSEQLVYNLYVTESQTASYFEFGLEYGNFEVVWHMDYGQLGLELEVSFTDGANTLVFSLGIIDGTIAQGSGITYNGTLVAVISGYILEDSFQVTITNAEGDPLTAAELAALEAVFDGMDELEDFMEGLFEFAVGLAYLAEPIN